MRIRTILASAVMLATAATGASAASVYYDFKVNAPNLQTVTYGTRGTALTVSSNINRISRHANGLGVTQGAEEGRLGLGEELAFAVKAGKIRALTMTFFEAGAEDETFAVVIDGVQTDLLIPGGTRGASYQSIDLTSLLPGGEVTTFTVVGLEPDAAGNRGIRLADVALTTIPLPAGGALLLTGLLGLVGLRRAR